MTTRTMPQRREDITALRDLLGELHGAQASLHAVLMEKLAAMRDADISGMQNATAEEGDLLSRFELLDAQRHTVTARLASTFGTPGGGPLRMSQVIAALDGADRREMSDLTDSLREMMLKVADANRVVTLVSREMNEHFKTIFEAMTQAAAESVGYSRCGRTETRAACLLDAVG